MNFSYLTFSDGAKFALIAKNIILGNGYTTDFSFWGTNLFATHGIPPVYPYMVSLFFKVFGISDLSVIYTSFFFYMLLIISVFLLARKLSNTVTALLSSVAVGANINFIDYATSGASEVFFAFEIVLALYLLSFRKMWINIAGFVTLGVMYFTRPQAFIFIAGIFLFWLILRLGLKKAFTLFFGLGLVGMFLDRFVIFPLSFKYPSLTPVLYRGIESIFTYSSSSAVSNDLRGALPSTLEVSDVLKKTFYNLYNFYKALPEIINPYLFALFVIGMFKKLTSFKVSVFFMFATTFIVTALSIPFYRYLHPVVPLIYIISIITLSEFIKSKRLLILLVIILAVGQTLGVLLLDSRFEKSMKNTSKPPIYVEMSHKLNEVTKPTDVVLTNLDTWGSWYGQRKTVWFPLTTDLFLKSPNKFDVIYLTSYKINDANYYMGEDWKEIFDNPQNQSILFDYKFVGEYEFKAQDNYENEDGKSILLIREQ